MTNTCRHCQSSDTIPFLDLGCAPPSNNYLLPEELEKPETTFPLRLFVCRTCRLVQTEDFASGEMLFRTDYAYFSSTSSSWLAHAKKYCEMITRRLGLGPASNVLEVASNDGYLLRNFRAWGIPCLGIEPTHSTAQAARALGIDVIEAFFDAELATKIPPADLIIGNNVFAHVPDVNDFSIGLARSLKPHGVVTLEFPHLLNLVRHSQFDTVYHEHFSYISLLSAEKILAKAGLRVFDVDQLSTHGGSLRLYSCLDHAPHAQTKNLQELREEENAVGMDSDEFYSNLQADAERVKTDFLQFLSQVKAQGKSIAGYGAAAKGNTLLNFAGVTSELIPFVCDAAASKIGKYLPGSHIPILAPAALENAPPDFIVIFPWNIADEIKQNLARFENTKFVTAIPELDIQ